MLNILLIVMIIVGVGIVHYGLEVEVWTGIAKSAAAGITMMFHVLVLVSYRHSLVHQCDLLKMEVVGCILSSDTVVRAARFSCGVSQMVMEVGRCVMLLPDVHVMVEIVRLSLTHNCHLLSLVEICLRHIVSGLRVISISDN